LQAHGCLFAVPELENILNREQFYEIPLEPGTPESNIREVVNEVSVISNGLEIATDKRRNKFTH
jgi:hypothetical protein